MADFITQFAADEGVSRDNFNSRIAEANAGLTTVQGAAAAAQTTANTAVSNAATAKTAADNAAAAAAVAQTTADGKSPVSHTHTPAAIGTIRVYTSLSELGLTESNATINNIVAAMADNTELLVLSATTGASTGLVPGTYGVLSVTKCNENYVEFEYQRSGGELWRGYYNYAAGTKWSGWRKIDTSAPPTWYNLAPSSGWTVGTAGFRYCKKEGGTVFLTGSLIKSSTPASGETIAILPAGFRPAVYVSFVMVQLTGWRTVMCVEPSGVVRFYNSVIPSGWVTTDDTVINVSFPAATA